MTTEFNLTDAIRSVIDETDLTEPRDIASRVACDTPKARMREAYIEALTSLVRIELGKARMHSAHASDVKPSKPARRPQQQSAKVAALREYAEAWRRRLRDRLFVIDGWKLLADCTAADFRFAAEQRRTIAHGILANAEELNTYADACEAHDVATFADLPEDIQAKLLDKQHGDDEVSS
jgi:hypothetical protein